MTPTETARTIIERAGAILAEPERLYLRRVMAGIAQAAGEMWDDLTLTFAHLLS